MTQSLSLLRIIRTAQISDDGVYRYALRRVWNDSRSLVNFVMLNPSTADATNDDATVRRCMAYARDWMYGGIIVTNLFALRSRHPWDLQNHPDPIGSENDAVIVSEASAANMVVAAWGNAGLSRSRATDVVKMLHARAHDIYCLDVSIAGEPVHPLYRPKDVKPRLYMRS